MALICQYEMSCSEWNITYDRKFRSYKKNKLRSFVLYFRKKKKDKQTEVKLGWIRHIEKTSSMLMILIGIERARNWDMEKDSRFPESLLEGACAWNVPNYKKISSFLSYLILTVIG